ncbi:MAG TPA: hypothetical protein VKM36_01010 [Balneolaceae bacterium]|nr:hypothetical protein [Balneolaceae bacterium]
MKILFRALLKGLKWILIFLIGLLFISALYNLTLPDSSSVTEKLTESQKAYLAEYMQLQDEVMDTVWPGFAKRQIPAIVYNEEYAFLVGLENPDAGWYKMPSGEYRGGEWEKVSGDYFIGKPYYRQSLPDKNVTPENFTVKVGDTWVSTMQTREYAEVAFYNGFSSELPPVINWVFPYKLFWNLIMGSAETYITGLIHEAFHAYQGFTVYDKFEKAESFAKLSSEYPWNQQGNRSGWRAEAGLLMRAYESESEAQTIDLIREFIMEREQRREAVNLSGKYIDYERNREWLEGLAKYVELKTGLVAESSWYEPIAEAEELGDFESYTNSREYLKNQIAEVSRAASRSGESRFYYGGMLQAMLLDRTMPGWKSEIFKENLYMEDLLREVSISKSELAER